MKKHVLKFISLVLVIVTITAFMAVPASATWIYPDGATIYDYLVNTDDYNRTIYVYHRDTSGTLLKYCVYYTETHGDYDVFGDSLIQARSLGDDGGIKSAITHILDIYNYNNKNPLPVNF